MTGPTTTRRDRLLRARATVARLIAGPRTPREIWFRRFLHGYWPSHWRGWALVAALMGLIAACNAVMFQVAPGKMNFALIVTLPLAVLGWVVIERHTEPRRRR